MTSVNPFPALAQPASDDAPSRLCTLAKIVATIGPASDAPETVARLIEAGVSVFRFNFSHGTLEDHKRRLDTVRAAAAKLDRPVAALGDLQGPKIRVGKVPEGGIVLEPGQDVVFRPGLDIARVEAGDNGAAPVVVLPTSYQKLVEEVEPGHKVLINDGLIRMLAVDRSTQRNELRCRVVIGGLVTSGKGINLPSSDISAPSITEKDWECAQWAVANGLDFLALSFVRRADEIVELKERLAGLCPVDGRRDSSAFGAEMPIVSKIEKPQALKNLQRIVEVSDAVMVARGDLGVEMDIARVPVSQKEIVAACAEWGRPCIVATQMLETMIENATPTRAEASDVANAIFDGADAVMLSAETATGKHPVLVVETMKRIIAAAEARIADISKDASPPRRLVESRYPTAALAHGAWHIATDIGAKLVVCWSERGGTARYLSQNNFKIPIIAYSSDPRATRRMALLGGVTPVHSPPPASATLGEWNSMVDRLVLHRGLARRGDKAVLLAGKPLGKPKVTNTLAIHTVGEPGSGYGLIRG